MGIFILKGYLLIVKLTSLDRKCSKIENRKLFDPGNGRENEKGNERRKVEDRYNNEAPNDTISMSLNSPYPGPSLFHDIYLNFTLFPVADAHGKEYTTSVKSRALRGQRAAYLVVYVQQPNCLVLRDINFPSLTTLLNKPV